MPIHSLLFKLQTVVTDDNKKSIPFFVKKEIEHLTDSTTLLLHYTIFDETGNELGFLNASLRDNYYSLVVTTMGNKSDYSYVGTLLHEIAFKESMLYGKHGKVSLGGRVCIIIFSL